MKFTLIFPSPEATDLSIGLVFAPCAMWVQGDKLVLNPHPANPHYLQGDVHTLLAHPSIKGRIRHAVKQVVTLIIHPNGHGSLDDLNTLLEDLEAAQWRVVVVQLNDDMQS
jgi:hypothetical protein